MSVWTTVRDQDRVVATLSRAIDTDRVPHAYLFSGPPGAPLYDVAIALAASLNCLSGSDDHAIPPAISPAVPPRGDGCGECDSCRRILGGIHPDVVTLVREGAAQIVPIESVRNQVIARIGLPPHEARTRMFIVEEATAMAPPAANSLLKTLEEPPARTVFVLCTTAPEQLLPTIRSRCQRVRFAAGAALPDAIATHDPARAERVAALGVELAGDRHDPMLPARIAEGKGDAAPVLVAAARVLHARAHAAAAAADTGAARRASIRAQAILSWHTAVSIHNANPMLAIDALIAQLSRLPLVGSSAQA